MIIKIVLILFFIVARIIQHWESDFSIIFLLILVRPAADSEAPAVLPRPRSGTMPKQPPKPQKDNAEIKDLLIIFNQRDKSESGKFLFFEFCLPFRNLGEGGFFLN